MTRIGPLLDGDLEAAAALISEGLGRPWSAHDVDVERRRAGAIALVLHEGSLLGAALGWVVLDELEVSVVVVASAARRRGHGKALTLAMIDRARAAGARTGWLDVRADNAAAIALYAGLGFVEDGRRPRYYADGTDAVLMRVAIRREDVK